MSGREGRAPCRTAEFRALPSRAGQTRRITAAYLRYWGLGALAEDAALGVTGLLDQVSSGTGDEAGAGGPYTVRAELAQGLLTLSVRVRGEGAGPLCTLRVSRESGTGVETGVETGVDAGPDTSAGVVMDTAPPPRTGGAQPGEEAAALLG